MIANVITLMEDNKSFLGATNLIASSKKLKNDFEIIHFNAVTPNVVKRVMTEYRVTWNYPWQGGIIDIQSGLTKHAYQTKDPNKRMACSMSHYILWKQCFDSNESMLIFEHDSIFIKQLDTSLLERSTFDIVGLNDPRGATRKSNIYYNSIQQNERKIQPVPNIDAFNIPQGLAGNSAYYITPNGAKSMIDAVNQYGMWPNDALMCKQLIKNMGVTKTFYTRVQGLGSTTTL